VTIQDFLLRLEKVRRSGSRWVTRCPAHLPDRHPSLSVAEGDRGILLRCWSRGCSADEIVKALGLTMSDLFHDAPASRQARIARPIPERPPDWRRTSALQLDSRDSRDHYADLVITAATGLSLDGLSDEETDALMDAVRGAYQDRALADRLEEAAFVIREQGLTKERKSDHALRR